MIIDCHGHYTTEPQKLHDFRKHQVAAIKDPAQKPLRAQLKIGDDEIRESLEGAQLKFQRERGTNLTIFSPRASGMAHHIGDAGISLEWSQISNELIHRVCSLYPKNFIGVCQLPQSPGVDPRTCVGELERCVNEFGFVGCNLNPDPSGGNWNGPPLTDKSWRRALHQRRHHRLHAAHHVGPVQGFPDAEIHHPARRRRGAVSLGQIPGAGAGHEAAAARGAAAQERLFRHLRVSPAGHRAAHQGHPGRQHPVRLRNGGLELRADVGFSHPTVRVSCLCAGVQSGGGRL